MEIYPSLIEQSATSLFSYLIETEHLFNHFQIDIADGHFVTNTTLRTADIVSHLQSNPTLVPRATCEFHLMVEDFAALVPDLQTITQHLPITQIIIHLEPAIRWLGLHDAHLHEHLHDSFPFSWGIALSPEIDIATHYSIIQHFPTIQIMTIKPGAQGRPLIPETLDKTTQLRTSGYTGKIILDGAMNATNLPLVLDQPEWPDAICPGSFLREDTEEHLEDLLTIATEYIRQR